MFSSILNGLEIPYYNGLVNPLRYLAHSNLFQNAFHFFVRTNFIFNRHYFIELPMHCWSFCFQIYTLFQTNAPENTHLSRRLDLTKSCETWWAKLVLDDNPNSRIILFSSDLLVVKAPLIYFEPTMPDNSTSALVMTNYQASIRYSRLVLQTGLINDEHEFNWGYFDASCFILKIFLYLKSHVQLPLISLIAAKFR